MTPVWMTWIRQNRYSLLDCWIHLVECVLDAIGVRHKINSIFETMPERSKYQQSIIRNYYENRESISLQRAQELVTELYLSEGKKRQRHWKTLEGHLQKLGVKQDAIDKLVSQDDPQAAARMIERLGKEG